jgi:hypothetical protein
MTCRGPLDHFWDRVAMLNPHVPPYRLEDVVREDPDLTEDLWWATERQREHERNHTDCARFLNG